MCESPSADHGAGGPVRGGHAGGLGRQQTGWAGGGDRLRLRPPIWPLSGNRSCQTALPPGGCGQRRSATPSGRGALWRGHPLQRLLCRHIRLKLFLVTPTSPDWVWWRAMGRHGAVLWPQRGGASAGSAVNLGPRGRDFQAPLEPCMWARRLTGWLARTAIWRKPVLAE